MQLFRKPSGAGGQVHRHRDFRNIALMLVALSSLHFGHVVQAQTVAADDPDAPSRKSVENFSKIPLAASQLYPDKPEMIQKDEEKDFTREFIRVQWRPHDHIYLYVIRPAKVEKPLAAIYLYGHPSDIERYQDNAWCRRTTSGGYAAIGFVPALTGQRYHDRPMKQWFVSELPEALGASAHDVQMVLNYLADRGDFDMTRVGVFGVGAGGTIAVMAASVDSRITAIDLLNPWGDWPDWTAHSGIIPEEERAAYRKPKFLESVAAFDPVNLLPGLKRVHIRLNQLTDDEATPQESQKKIAAALPASAERYVYTGDMDFYSSAASGGRVFDWLKGQLKPADTRVKEALKQAPATPEARSR